MLLVTHSELLGRSTVSFTEKPYLFHYRHMTVTSLFVGIKICLYEAYWSLYSHNKASCSLPAGICGLIAKWMLELTEHFSLCLIMMVTMQHTSQEFGFELMSWTLRFSVRPLKSLRRTLRHFFFLQRGFEVDAACQTVRSHCHRMNPPPLWN